MFTGIVEELGEVVELVGSGEIHRLAIRAVRILADLEIGGSVAVNGCCLTATSIDGDLVRFDLARETVIRTRFDRRLRAGARVNLERPLRASGRLDGHFVQGHVDGVASIESIRERGGSSEITFDLPADLADYCVEKGSIALDGVSLTCAYVAGTKVTAALIPHTLKVTTFGGARPGDLVNVEVDILAKYVRKLARK